MDWATDAWPGEAAQIPWLVSGEGALAALWGLSGPSGRQRSKSSRTWWRRRPPDGRRCPSDRQLADDRTVLSSQGDRSSGSASRLVHHLLLGGGYLLLLLSLEFLCRSLGLPASLLLYGFGCLLFLVHALLSPNPAFRILLALLQLGLVGRILLAAVGIQLDFWGGSLLVLPWSMGMVAVVCWAYRRSIQEGLSRHLGPLWRAGWSYLKYLSFTMLALSVLALSLSVRGLWWLIGRSRARLRRMGLRRQRRDGRAGGDHRWALWLAKVDLGAVVDLPGAWRSDRRHVLTHAGLFAASLLLVVAQIAVLVRGGRWTQGGGAAPILAASSRSVVAPADSREKSAQTRRDLILAVGSQMPDGEEDGMATADRAAIGDPQEAGGMSLPLQFEIFQMGFLVQAQRRAAAERAAEEVAGRDSGAAVAMEVPAPVASTRGGMSYANWYPRGQCTWYAKERRPDLPWFSGNAGHGGNWAQAAVQHGFLVDDVPTVGAVAVFPPGANGSNSYYGHVAYIEEVRAGELLISECNNAWSYLLSDYPRWWAGGRACGYRLISLDELNPGVRYIHGRGEQGDG